MDKVAELIELAAPKDFSKDVTIDKCIHLLNEIFHMATTYSTDRKEDEKAFVLFFTICKFIC